MTNILLDGMSFAATSQLNTIISTLSLPPPNLTQFVTMLLRDSHSSPDTLSLMNFALQKCPIYDASIQYRSEYFRLKAQNDILLTEILKLTQSKSELALRIQAFHDSMIMELTRMIQSNEASHHFDSNVYVNQLDHANSHRRPFLVQPIDSRRIIQTTELLRTPLGYEEEKKQKSNILDSSQLDNETKTGTSTAENRQDEGTTNLNLLNSNSLNRVLKRQSIKNSNESTEFETIAAKKVCIEAEKSEETQQPHDNSERNRPIIAEIPAVIKAETDESSSVQALKNIFEATTNQDASVIDSLIDSIEEGKHLLEEQ